MWRQMVEKMGTTNTQEADNNFHRKRNSGSRRRRKCYPAKNGKFSKPEAVNIVRLHLCPQNVQYNIFHCRKTNILLEQEIGNVDSDCVQI